MALALPLVSTLTGLQLLDGRYEGVQGLSPALSSGQGVWGPNHLIAVLTHSCAQIKKRTVKTHTRCNLSEPPSKEESSSSPRKSGSLRYWNHLVTAGDWTLEDQAAERAAVSVGSHEAETGWSVRLLATVL